MAQAFDHGRFVGAIQITRKDAKGNWLSGWGWWTQAELLDWVRLSDTAACDACDSTGQANGQTCSACGGTGRLDVSDGR